MALHDTSIEHTLEESYAEYPRLGYVAQKETLPTEIRSALEVAGIDTRYTERAVLEVRLVLALYAPLSDIKTIVASWEGVGEEKAETFYNLLLTLVLSPVREELEFYDEKWTALLKEHPETPVDESEKEEALTPEEPLELKPESATQPTFPPPLTREELLRALSAKRTMASDMEVAQEKKEEEKDPYEL